MSEEKFDVEGFENLRPHLMSMRQSKKSGSKTLA